jgi:serine/threonine protein kinase
MVTGELPFKGDYDQAVIYSIMNENPNFSAILKTKHQNILNEVIRHCLKKDPKSRYNSIDDLLMNIKQELLDKDLRIDIAMPHILPVHEKKKIIPITAIAIIITFVAILTNITFYPSDDQKPIFSNPIILSGEIVDFNSNPINNARVTISAVHFKTYTRNDGCFQEVLEGKSSGDKITLIISHPNFVTHKIDVILTGKNQALGKIVLND